MRRLWPIDMRSLFDDDVGIRAAETETADTGASWRGAVLPFAKRCGNLDGRLFETQQRVDGRQTEMRRNLPVPKHLDQLDQTRDARGTFQVANVGLHRADH